jgi:uracil-DNA glycosylase family 4
MADKAAQLKVIEEDIKSNKICSELAAQATQLVMGDGSLDAKLMFIGEAPGAQEDIQGKPFVGAAGRFLNEMLDSINLKLEDVYITNIVKYRPPSNRDPLPEEKIEFMPYLMRQIEVIKPALIITLGRHSTNVFLPDVRISEAHGQPKRLKGQVYLPLYHPAAALYNGGMRTVLLEDFARIPKILELIEKDKAKA